MKPPQRPGYVQHTTELNAYLETRLARTATQLATSDTVQQLCDDSVAHHALLPSDLYRMTALVQHTARNAEWQAKLTSLLGEEQPISVRTWNGEFV